MPIYEYACPDCGHRFDALQKISDNPIQTCPKCSAGQVKKLISATSFVLKGSGWYKDHYGLKGGPEGESAKESKDAPAAPAAPAAAAPAAPAAPAAAPAAPAAPASGTGT